MQTLTLDEWEKRKMTNSRIEQVDIVIVGAGIAGLWLLNTLQKQGYRVILLENKAIGSGQTIKAQGIIHGGIKYALTGKLTAEAKAIADMPRVWQACMQGKGDIDLSYLKVLSPYHYLWTQGSLRGQISQFLSTQVLASHSQAISHKDFPALFQHPAFKGRVYRVSENVIDVFHLLKILSQPYQDAILKIDHFDLQLNNKEIDFIRIYSSTVNQLDIKASCYIFTAGEGNQPIINLIPDAPAMQRRPLHMVLAKLPYHFSLYAHCLGSNAQPRITITTHIAEDGKTIWYLGGAIAEKGVARTQAEQIAFAKEELSLLFPWLDFSNVTFTSFFIDRAEVQQPNQSKPDSVYYKFMGNSIIAWPTKLAFAPLLSQHILAALKKNNILPVHHHRSFNVNWPLATLSLPIWEELLA